MKILFIAPLPPPLGGHSLAAKVLLDDLEVDNAVEVVDLNRQSMEVGKVTLDRIIAVGNILRNVWRKRNDNDAIYLTVSESLFGNIKDIIIYLICFNDLSKMYIHLHGGSIKKILFERYKFLFRVNEFFLRRLKGVIILGPSHSEIFGNGIDPERIHIVPNFAEDFLFSSPDEIKDKFHSAEPLRIIYISNMIRDKGYGELLEAYLCLDESLRNSFRIDFAGRFETDEQKKSFLERIEGISGITYHGVIEGTEKKELFSKAHIFCLPTSFLEGQPISILEAYACGCVVLATGQPGIKDIFKNGENGFEIRERSGEAIKLALERTFREKSNLLSIAIENRRIAGDKYRMSTYNNSLRRIIEDRPREQR